MPATAIKPFPPAPADPRKVLFDPFEGHGVAIAVAGPPGTGKSTFAGSCARYGRVALLGAKPREVNSWLYRELADNISAKVYHDPLWRPTLGKYEASAFIDMATRILQLYEDTEYDFVIVDPFTDVVALVAHEMMKVEKAATPRDLRDSLGFYGGLKYRLKEFTQMLTALCFAPHPKHVIVTVHTQPPKDDTPERGGGTKESVDNKSSGVEYEGNVLPMIEGGYRREFAGEFDAMLYTDIQTKKERVGSTLVDKVSYRLQVIPDNERHAKTIFGTAFTEKYIPNDFGEILKAVTKGRKP